MAMAMSVSSMYTDKWMLGAILRNGINQIFLLIQICLNTTSDHKLLGKFGCQLSSLVVKNTIEMQPMRKTNFKKKKKKVHDLRITLMKNSLPIVSKNKSLL